jgi:hypothetical protein
VKANQQDLASRWLELEELLARVESRAVDFSRKLETLVKIYDQAAALKQELSPDRRKPVKLLGGDDQCTEFA